MTRLILIFNLTFVFNISAKIYSHDEIERTLSQPSTQLETQEFISAFFIAKNPQKVINNLLHNKSFNSLMRESKLNALLTEISSQVKQPFLQKFVMQMQNYSSQAFKMHEEGRMPVPVFNLSAKAQGIENIWQASESLHEYTQKLNSNPLETLQHLRGHIATLSQPEWLGLKQSMQNISAENQLKISQYFLTNVDNMTGLDRFVGHYVLLTADKVLTLKALSKINNTNQQYILRLLAEYFPQDFVIKTLQSKAQSQNNAAFALTLLKPYVFIKPQVQAFVIDALADKKLSSQAAFALVDDDNAKILTTLENVYKHSHSTQQKYSIKQVLQLSHNKQSKTILDRINQYDLLQVKQGSQQ